MLLPKIVMRNVMAHRRKNLVVFAVTGCVSMFLFLFLCFSDGEIENIRNGVSSFFTPWIDVVAATDEALMLDGAGKSSAEATVADTDRLTEGLSALPFVKEAFGRVSGNWGNLYWKGDKYLDFRYLALDSRDSVLRSKYRIVEGRDLEPGETGSALIHKAVLKTLALSPGDPISLVGNDSFGQVMSMDLALAGVFEPVLDNPNLYNMIILPREDLSTFNGYTPNESRSLGIRLEKGVSQAKAIPLLEEWGRQNAPNLRFVERNMKGYKDDFSMVFGMIRMIIVVMSLLTLLITSVGIMSVISTNLQERKKEIGTYYCLGSEPPFLIAAYSLELALVNLAASAAGILGGLLIRAIVNVARITSDEPGFQVVAGGSQFRLGLTPSSVLWIIGGVVVITLLTALTTLGKALKVSPVEAVREAE